MEDLYSWMNDFTESMIENSEALLDIINQESPYKVRDISELNEEKVA